MQAFEALVARLPRLAILVLFAVPFAVAEPLKIVGLLEIAEGHVAYGIGVLIFSYILTFFLVERIYHAGRTKLLSYGWFAWGMGYINAVRDVVVAYKTRTIRKANALFRVIRRGAAA